MSLSRSQSFLKLGFDLGCFLVDWHVVDHLDRFALEHSSKIATRVEVTFDLTCSLPIEPMTGFNSFNN